MNESYSQVKDEQGKQCLLLTTSYNRYLILNNIWFNFPCIIYYLNYNLFNEMLF